MAEIIKMSLAQLKALGLRWEGRNNTSSLSAGNYHIGGFTEVNFTLPELKDESGMVTRKSEARKYPEAPVKGKLGNGTVPVGKFFGDELTGVAESSKGTYYLTRKPINQHFVGDLAKNAIDLQDKWVNLEPITIPVQRTFKQFTNRDEAEAVLTDAKKNVKTFYKVKILTDKEVETLKASGEI